MGIHPYVNMSRTKHAALPPDTQAQTPALKEG